MPGKPFDSKLLPLLDFIVECRKRHWSYRRIARELQAQHSITVAHSSIFSFVKCRSRKRKVYEILEDPKPRTSPWRTPDDFSSSFFHTPTKER